ncbi:unnamed protein product [Penicillium salamii]|uniref:UBA domain-containing protein n=1 Tax=Penicillium salamii TaxID=1612424 RepID=A0A9W4NIK8_9EURO|nr:unnamed protein product [Penicillium salamii]CAG8127190.1 unnamed protein product [Penicillium salamii]CAG8221878.1 unnamed protein product [Penicillium salamii]CAG8325720.1 unnamed protein product [Penicillium salamii]CAG8372776.1 unnamed protein product [Penicillium salamii]
MDDLSGLSWSDAKSKPPPMSSGYLFPTVPSNGGSGRSTPLSTPSNRSNSPAKPATSTGDSFANLVSFNSSAASKSLSLAEQQKRMQEEKAKKEADNRNRLESQYGGQNNQFWDTFEQGRTQSPAIPASRSVPPAEDDDDILGAFSADAPVDASTHFPVPASARASPAIATNSRPGPPSGGIAMQDNTGGLDAFEDDDPFGLNQLKPKSAPAPAPQQVDDDDFLGLLGKPVSEIPRQQPSPAPAPTISPDHDREQDASPMPSNEVDRAIAELVDMGFPADKSRRALKTTQSGTDVQGAVGWLLTQAHAESRQKTDGRANDRPAERSERSDSRNRDRPSWMREESHGSRSREDRRSPASADKDPAQMAAQFGNNFLKQAGSLWKTGSKKFQQAVNEFNHEHDPSQPRWMKEGVPQQDELPSQPQRPRGEQQTQSQVQQDFTNEALLLESGDGRPQKPTRSRENQRPDPRSQPRDQQHPGPAQPKQQGNFLERPSRPSSQDPRSRVSRFAAEEQQAQAYVSPARRKRPQAPPAPEPAVDLFDSPAPVASRPKPSAPAQTSTPARSTPIPVRPKAPTRSIPPLSQQALQSTHRHRGKAADSYKRGDYAEAHQSFSTALGMLPEKHPITIIIRSNRAMTALKIGEPKSAVEDADIILTFIGPSKGESEVIDLGNGESPKPMKDFYGKALMRKAEALEQLERWGDAAQAWKDAVESGHGGSTSIQGRNRCEKAAGTSKPQQPAPRKRPTPAPKASALSALAPTSASGSDFESVSRLRQANQAAERADEEKFALSESVDARIATWRNGKQDNLRALLGSLDSVLWPEAGWKKIGLSELVLPNKVKIQYMKGIGKVHPDKISTTATTEQRMIAGSVFGTLNEAWDKFRIENNL